MEKIMIVGNLGDAASEKQVGQGTVVEFSVACNRKVKGEDKTSWYRCSYWGKGGQAVKPYLTKGTTVAVCGDLDVRMYESNGKTGVSRDVRVDSLQLCGGKKQSNGDAPEPADGGDGDPPF